MSQRKLEKNLKIMEKFIKLFPSVPHEFVRLILHKNISTEHELNWNQTFRDLLEFSKETKPLNEVELWTIKQIFPDLEIDYIKRKLVNMGFISNRVEIFVRKHLAKEDKKKWGNRQTGDGGLGTSLEFKHEKPKRNRLYSKSQEETADQLRKKNEAVAAGVFEILPSTSGGTTNNLLIAEKMKNEVNNVPNSATTDEIPTKSLPSSDNNQEVPDVVTIDSDEENDGAIAAINVHEEMNRDDHIDKRLFYHIMEIFPQANPDFLRDMVRHKRFNEAEITNIVDRIFNTPNYPKRNHQSPPRNGNKEINKEDKLALLRELLPKADPDFLEESLQDINTEKELEKFVSKCFKNKNYPTYKEFERKKKLSAQVKQYTTEFSISKFLNLHPDPVAFFESAQCKAMYNIRPLQSYVDYFLRNMFPMIQVKHITRVISEYNDLLSMFNELKRCESMRICLLRQIRKIEYSLDGLEDIPLLQAFSYLSHKDEIVQYLESQKQLIEKQRAEAKEMGLMQTCNCCYNEEVMPDEVVTCDAGCEFCKSCLRESVKILFSEGKLDFPCLASCGSNFGIQVLQTTVDPKLFSKLVQKKQLEEIKAASIEDIAFCPFCDFATILAPENKLFVCLNPDCMTESCRLCKEPSHIPLRCDEVEKDDDIKQRIYIENKMTEALIRKCPNCSMTFIKEDGCNKMTCSCGASMCYICNKPVTDYKHFNGQGGQNFHLCPLYSDTVKLHRDAVLKSAAEAKKELGVKELKVDPTKGIKEHYAKEAEKNPNPVPPGVLA